MSQTNAKITISAVDNASGIIKNINQQLQGFESEAKNIKSVLTGLGSLSLGALGGLSLGAGISSSISQTARFEKEINNLSKVTNEDLGQLKEKILSLPSSLGSATELTQGYYQIISAGITDSSQAMDTLTASSKAAIAAGITQSGAIKVATSLMEGYKGEVKNASDALDKLFAIERVGKTSFAELEPYIGSLASTSKLLGININEMGGALAQLTLTSGGTEKAATQYQNLLSSFLKPTKELDELFKRLGANNFNELITKFGGLEKAIYAIREGANKGGYTIAQLFGSQESIKAYAELSTKLEEMRSKIEDVANSADTTEKNFAVLSNSADELYKVTGNLIEKLGIEFGKGVLPGLKDGLIDVNAALENSNLLARALGETTGVVFSGFGKIIDEFFKIYDTKFNLLANNALIIQNLLPSQKPVNEYRGKISVEIAKPEFVAPPQAENPIVLTPNPPTKNNSSKALKERNDVDRLAYEEWKRTEYTRYHESLENEQKLAAEKTRINLDFTRQASQLFKNNMDLQGQILNEELKEYQTYVDNKILLEEYGERKRLELSTSALDGMKLASINYFESSSNQAQQFGDLLTNVFQAGEDTFVKMVTNQKVSFTDLTNSIIADLARIVYQQSISNIGKGLLGMFGSGGGVPITPFPGINAGVSSPLGGGGFLGSIFNSLFGSQHSGGIVGRNTAKNTHALSPLVFANAPRYHDGGVIGLLQNELPIIAQKGERIFSTSSNEAIIAQLNSIYASVSRNNSFAPIININPTVIDRTKNGVSAKTRASSDNNGNMTFETIIDDLDSALGQKIMDGTSNIASSYDKTRNNNAAYVAYRGGS